MALKQLFRTTLALMVGALMLGGASTSFGLGTGSAANAISGQLQQRSTSNMLRVANNTQVSSGEAEDAVLGTWQGGWTNDRSRDNGTLTIDVKSAKGGIVTGSGSVTGGPCAQDFALTGWYRGSLVELQLDFTAGGEGCAGGKVTISMRTGRNAGKLMGIGHWADVTQGRAVSHDFGIIELVKQ